MYKMLEDSRRRLSQEGHLHGCGYCRDECGESKCPRAQTILCLSDIMKSMAKSCQSSSGLKGM
ncbi:unnamed protein product [Discosporangium mesarthrocarpum]